MQKFSRVVFSRGINDNRKYYQEDKRAWVYNIIFPLIASAISLIVRLRLGLVENNNIFNEIKSIGIIGLLSCVIWYFLVSIYFWIVAPAKIFYEQNEIINLLEKKQKEDPIKFELIDEEHTHDNKKICIPLLVCNESPYDIEDCRLMIYIESLNGLRNLAWSEKNKSPNLDFNPTKLLAMEYLRSDIVITWDHESWAILQIMEKFQDDKIIKPGTYKMTISAMGKFNGNLIEHKENFLFTYRNQGDISLALLEK